MDDTNAATGETGDGSASETELGVEENVAAALAYLLGPLSGLAVFVVEGENEFVRFHAMQSIMVGVALFAGISLFTLIPIVGWVVSLLGTPVAVLVLLFMLFKAYQGEEWEFPVVGEAARDYI